MLRRLIAWCVPNSALQLRMEPPPAAEPEPERADLARTLSPYGAEDEIGAYRAARARRA